MLRFVLGVIAGFIAWVIALVGSEKILSAIWPDGFGVHQRAFQEVLANGGEFTANTTHLITHFILGAAVSMFSGYLAALIAGENTRAPLVLGILLLALGLLKAYLSWQFVPFWYHIAFTAILFPLAIMGGKLHSTN